jgi:preprotein translocase subunit SecG
MLWIIGFFTVILVIDCLLLVLLVLVQLPKKEAGIGQAFGGAATDALFGAGSGNALTKMTKYATGIFFVLTLAIYIMYNHEARARAGGFATRVQQAARDSENQPAKPPPANLGSLTNNKAIESNKATQAGTNAKGGLLTQPNPEAEVPTTTTAPAPAPKPAPVTNK